MINAGGYALKWLFGVPTNDDLDGVNVRVDELYKQTGDLISSKEDQLTLMKKMNSKIVTNTKAINEMMTKLIKSNKQYVDSLRNYTLESSNIHNSVFKYMQMIAMSRHLGQVVDEAKLRIVEFRQALELINTGKVSSKLLPPHDFIKILYSIERIVPTHLKLIMSVDEENLFMYYDICTAQALATPSSIKLVVTIPLSSNDRQLETYRVVVVPLYQPSLSHWIKWDMNYDYLLVSKDRQYFAPLTESMFSKCKNKYFYLCPSSISLTYHTVEDCTYSLFMGLMDSAASKCSKIVSSKVISPFLLQNGNDWLYSVSEPYKVVLNCFSYNSNQPEYSELLLNSSGIIRQVSSCDIFGRSRKIFSRISGNIKFKGNLTHIHVPKFDNMLTVNEKEIVFSGGNLTFDTLKDIKNNLDDDSIDVTLTALIKTIKDNKNKSTVLYHFQTYAVSYLMCVFLSLLFCILFWVYNCRRCSCPLLISRATTEPQTESQRTTIHASQGTPLHDILQSTTYQNFDQTDHSA